VTKLLKGLSTVGMVLLVLGLVAKGTVEIYVHSEYGLDIDFAKQSQYKWQVRVNAIPAGPCGGVMVARQWVLTAAHCLKDSSGEVNDKQVRIIAGTRDLRLGKPMKIERKEIPDDFVYRDDMPVKFDLALIKLASVPADTTVIRFSSDDELLKKVSYVAGWACFPHKNRLLSMAIRWLASDCGNVLGYTAVCDGQDAACAQKSAAWFVCAGGSEIHGIPGFDMTDSGGGLTNAIEGDATLLGIANYDPLQQPGCQTYAFIGYVEYLDWIRARICADVTDGSEINCPASSVPPASASIRTRS
jgi:trypsin